MPSWMQLFCKEKKFSYSNGVFVCQGRRWEFQLMVARCLVSHGIFQSMGANYLTTPIFKKNQWVQWDIFQNRWVQLHPLTHLNDAPAFEENCSTCMVTAMLQQHSYTYNIRSLQEAFSTFVVVRQVYFLKIARTTFLRSIAFGRSLPDGKAARKLG